MEVDLTKMNYREELKNWEKNNTSKQTVRAGKAAPDKTKMLKKAEGDESPQPTVVANKAALDKAQKTRNEVQEQIDMLGLQIFQL